MSRPRIASFGSEVTSAVSPSSRAFSANRSAVSRLRLYATTRSSAKRARSVQRFASACVPQATKPAERLWGLASTVAAAADGRCSDGGDPAAVEDGQRKVTRLGRTEDEQRAKVGQPAASVIPDVAVPLHRGVALVQEDAALAGEVRFGAGRQRE